MNKTTLYEELKKTEKNGLFNIHSMTSFVSINNFITVYFAYESNDDRPFIINYAPRCSGKTTALIEFYCTAKSCGMQVAFLSSDPRQKEVISDIISKQYGENLADKFDGDFSTGADDSIYDGKQLFLIDNIDEFNDDIKNKILTLYRNNPTIAVIATADDNGKLVYDYDKI